MIIILHNWLSVVEKVRTATDTSQNRTNHIVSLSIFESNKNHKTLWSIFLLVFLHKITAKK